MMAIKKYKNSILRRFPETMSMFVAMVFLTASPARAGEPTEQRGFLAPQQAVAALIAAVKDANETELLAILGPDSEDLVSSGDKVADQNGRTRFLQAFEEKNSLEQAAEGRVLLIVGGRDYPFPIPIVREGNLWRFDTPAGVEEILNRRIGRNELRTIEAMRAYADAQREFACRKDTGISAFAQTFVSSEGKKDGLYWDAAPGDQESPFGPLIARATREGYSNGFDQEDPEPFHGYYFKILKAQGEHASGGAFDYVADGRMVLGFALVAYPAKYRVSGVMTFIVNQEGVIYEKDLGEDTVTEATAMTIFDPDDSWRPHIEPAGR